ncbi:MAG TPA: AMP-binding protein [Conexibacter sp.]|nr:AMP-binding protein [Conexibacter sp.]
MESWLPRAAALRPDRAALVTPTETLSYAELLRQAGAMAATLRQAGIESGDRIAIALPPGVPFLVALHATFLLGAAAVPIDLRLGESERAERTSSAKLVIEEAIKGEGSIEPGDIDPNAVATVIHTSGTTASPKAVELTYGNWLANARGSAAALGLDPGERWLCTLPLSHVGGLSILIRSAIYGTTVVLHERFDAEAVRTAIVEEAVTVVSLVPTTLERLLDAGLRSPASLRVALVGGAPLTRALAARAKQAGIPVAQTYGMTEACSQVTTSAIGEPETAGPPLLGTTVEIAADGEILVAGPTVAPGATAADGWLHTGDLGALDTEGRLIVTGRKADTIVTGGENVAPTEVETILLAHPAVADAGVYGAPDEQWGEAVVAAVVLRAPASEEELRAHVADQLARFKVPKRIAFAEQLPRTPSGKLLRRELREIG